MNTVQFNVNTVLFNVNTGGASGGRVCVDADPAALRAALLSSRYGSKPPFAGPCFQEALAGIWQLVVQIKTMQKTI